MKLGSVVLLSLVAAEIVPVCSMAQKSPFPETPPAEIVQRLWTYAMRGEFLNPEGVRRITGPFAKKEPVPDLSEISVISNRYGVNAASAEGDHATVDMEFTLLGTLNSHLKFTPAPPSKTYKTSMHYTLTRVPAHDIRYGADGKTIVSDKELADLRVWLIDGEPQKPWTTVNTAIRYVLEIKNKTKDADLRQNAEETLQKLLRLN